MNSWEVRIWDARVTHVALITLLPLTFFLIPNDADFQITYVWVGRSQTSGKELNPNKVDGEIGRYIEIATVTPNPYSNKFSVISGIL